MAGSSEFFGQRNPQAVLKHGVLTRYAHYFAGRAGRATGGKVAFIDGYAGEGRYLDESPGSPLLLASQAERAKVFGRDVKLAFVEQDDRRRAALSVSLDEAGVEADQLLGGDLEVAIDGLLDHYADRAVLVFVDPFGLAISRSTLERILRRSTRRHPIDVLYHFSLSSVVRMGRAAVAATPTAARNAEHLDVALGPVGWRPDFESANDANAPTKAALDVAQRFGASVRSSTGVRSTAIPVRQRPGQLPRYLLMMFSSNAQAHWDFADVAGKAHVDWLHHCDREDFDANVRQRQEQGVLLLIEPVAPSLDDIDEKLRADSVRYLRGHLVELLQRTGPIVPIERIEEVYGEALGRARITHVRDAVKELHADGAVVNDGKGDFQLRPLALRR